MSSAYQYSSTASSSSAATHNTAATTVCEMELGGRKLEMPAAAIPRVDVTLEDLPPVLRFCVAYNAGGSGCCIKLVFFAGSALNSAFPFLIFASATGSLAIGVAFSVLAFLSNGGSMVGPNYPKSPLLLAVLHAQADEMGKAVKGFLVITTVFFSAIVMPVAFLFLITPNIINTRMLGPESYTISLALAIASCLSMPVVLPMSALSVLFEKVQLEWCKRIDIYLRQVQGRLLKIADGADSPEEVIASLAELQEENEAWAREMNGEYSTLNGVSALNTLAWSFLPLAMIAVPTDADTRLAQVIVLSCFAAFFQLIFVSQLTGLTKVNMAWDRGTARLLNDARIQLLRLNTLGVHGAFASWLQNHELNAARASGVKVTLKLLRSSAGAIGSLFILATYLVLRENLSGLLG